MVPDIGQKHQTDIGARVSQTKGSKKAMIIVFFPVRADCH
jgi:hypothetical protein